ncbi:MAG: YgfZ/GcvT domain-containing protein [Planctomycetota bacterium]
MRFLRVSDRGWVQLAGPDAPGFLQRILTSDVLGLAPGGGQWSALLDGKGKWVADLLVYRLEGASAPVLGLDCPAERTTAVLKALDRYHFGEDLECSGGNSSRLLVMGPGAGPVLARCGRKTPPGPFGICPEGELLILARPDRGTPVLEWVGREEDWKPIQEALEQDPAAVPAGPEELEGVRIAAFRPRFGAEFDEGSILPESGEWQRVSFTKGCYAGQEVVAKVSAFGRAPRLLCRLFFEEGAVVSFTGAVLEDRAGNRAGRVTSWTLPQGSSRAVGLGIVRRASAEEGCRLLACRGDQRAEVEIRLPPLPPRLPEGNPKE